MEKFNISAGIGQTIRLHRIKKELTQADLAKLLGVSKSTIGKWETGVVQNLKMDTINSLVKFLGIEPLSLTGISLADNQHQKIIVSMTDFTKEEFDEVCDYIKFIKSKRQH